MRLTVLGACGAWPEAGRACSGYLVEHDGFRLLVDVGYATVPRLFELIGAAEVDAVFISHGHADHCADLNPLLRARTLLLDGPPCPPLPVYSPPGALDAVLALDRPATLSGAYRLPAFTVGDELLIGPFRAQTALLPHWLPDAGVRLTAGGQTLVYTGDAGAAPEVVALARDADLLLAEATFVDEVPEDSRRYLCSAAEAGRQASQAGVGRLVLTHLQPGTDRRAARGAAARGYRGPIDVADSGLTIDLH